MRTFYDFLIETDSLVRQTSIHTPPANHVMDKSRYGRAKVMFGETDSADGDVSPTGTIQNANGDPCICQKQGCENSISKYMMTRIEKLTEKGKKVNPSMNLCSSCYKEWIKVPGTALKLKSGKSITSREPKSGNGTVQQVTTQEGDPAPAMAENDDQAYLQQLKKVLESKSSSSSGVSARLSQQDMETKSPAEIENEIRMFTERLRNAQQQPGHLND